MKQLVAGFFALMPLAVWAHAGHGLAQGHEWFHALFPFVGAAGVLLLCGAAGRVRDLLVKLRNR